ncbi:hypothetical protein [Mucilaginibacter myungsuensis]|uniref:Viral A-type inclusion protein n=1 Tax=Mucilaginibacter myungsuensis TaxID=649104 RepID=A0A929PUN0_9SPHI|nr:hypothetical protein [Mucilaginibacter myungsuensis]MBE9660289.1 hypothetical protein [Mucilaginibacter myungsuensis]MDN3600331.1 hypothetical protein [Mucilaginibacter myungsuensis]
MKKTIIIALFASFFLASCSDEKAAEKKQMDAVIAIHDSVMARTGTAMKYQAELDSLYLKPNTDTLTRKTIADLRGKLILAESAMETWMHKFDPDFSGKQHADIMNYLGEQHKQIHRVDSLVNKAIADSKQFLEAK